MPNTLTNMPNTMANGAAGSLGWLAGRLRAGIPAARVASCIVITVGAPALPGVTVGGLKVAVAPAGRPEADRVTTLLNAPPSGGTVMSTVAAPPDATGTAVAGAVTVNDVATVKLRAEEVDGANPASPAYSAVMLSEPTTRLLVVNVATPEALRVPVPSKVVPL
jgi:hypothetical protein